MSFFVLGWLWPQHELPYQRVIGRTPKFAAQTRGAEIKHWLDDATRYWKTDRVRRYAVLDDETEPILHHIRSTRSSIATIGTD